MSSGLFEAFHPFDYVVVVFLVNVAAASFVGSIFFGDGDKP